MLAGFDLAALDRDPSVTYGLTRELRIGYLNDAWFSFARANGGEAMLARFGLGASVLDGIRGPLRDFYAAALQSVQRTGDPWEHSYPCPSASLQRDLRMRVMLLPKESLLVVHSVIATRPAEAAQTDVRDAELRFVAADGFVRQCSYCRRVRSLSPPRWEWHPDFVERPPRAVTHGICEVCTDYYFPRDSKP